MKGNKCNLIEGTIVDRKLCEKERIIYLTREYERKLCANNWKRMICVIRERHCLWQSARIARNNDDIIM